MKPDEKYMMDALRQPDDEMKFKPFNPDNFIPNLQNNVIPVMLWGNLVINPSNFPSGYNFPNKPNSTLTGNYNPQNTYGSMSNNNPLYQSNTSTNVPPMYSGGKYNSQNLSMSYESNNPNMSNVNETNYPDETQSSYLYSYNKGNRPVSSSMNINNNDTMNNILKSLDSSIDEDRDLARTYCDDKVNRIYKKILDDCNLMSIFKGYEIPKPIIKLIIMKTIKHTLKYCKKGREY